MVFVYTPGIVTLFFASCLVLVCTWDCNPFLRASPLGFPLSPSHLDARSRDALGGEFTHFGSIEVWTPREGGRERERDGEGFNYTGERARCTRFPVRAIERQGEWERGGEGGGMGRGETKSNSHTNCRMCVHVCMYAQTYVYIHTHTHTYTHTLCLSLSVFLPLSYLCHIFMGA